MKHKISILGLLFLTASICLVVWTFFTLSRPGYRSIELPDTCAGSHGWGGYEIRTGPDTSIPVAPRYTRDTGEKDRLLNQIECRKSRGKQSWLSFIARRWRTGSVPALRASVPSTPAAPKLIGRKTAPEKLSFQEKRKRFGG